MRNETVHPESGEAGYVTTSPITLPLTSAISNLSSTVISVARQIFISLMISVRVTTGEKYVRISTGHCGPPHTRQCPTITHFTDLFAFGLPGSWRIAAQTRVARSQQNDIRFETVNAGQLLAQKTLTRRTRPKHLGFGCPQCMIGVSSGSGSFRLELCAPHTQFRNKLVIIRRWFVHTGANGKVLDDAENCRSKVALLRRHFTSELDADRFSRLGWHGSA